MTYAQILADLDAQRRKIDLDHARWMAAHFRRATRSWSVLAACEAVTYATMIIIGIMPLLWGSIGGVAMLLWVVLQVRDAHRQAVRWADSVATLERGDTDTANRNPTFTIGTPTNAKYVN